MLDTAEGLYYLHSREPPVCHGDLKPVQFLRSTRHPVYSPIHQQANVLVNQNRRALLSDFGLAKILDETLQHGLTTTDNFKGSLPWCSRELLETGTRTTQSDMWAWALLVWEASRLQASITYYRLMQSSR